MTEKVVLYYSTKYMYTWSVPLTLKGYVLHDYSSTVPLYFGVSFTYLLKLPECCSNLRTH